MGSFIKLNRALFFISMNFFAPLFASQNTTCGGILRQLVNQPHLTIGEELSKKMSRILNGSDDIDDPLIRQHVMLVGQSLKIVTTRGEPSRLSINTPQWEATSSDPDNLEFHYNGEDRTQVAEDLLAAFKRAGVQTSFHHESAHSIFDSYIVTGGNVLQHDETLVDVDNHFVLETYFNKSDQSMEYRIYIKIEAIIDP
jgi:hypothetical protein